jgi:hypothetical protein
MTGSLREHRGSGGLLSRLILIDQPAGPAPARPIFSGPGSGGVTPSAIEVPGNARVSYSHAAAGQHYVEFVRSDEL